MSAPVLTPVLTVTFTPGALRAGLVVAVIRIRLVLSLPPSSAFALALRLTTEPLLGNLRARAKTHPAACTSPALHGSTPGRITPSRHACPEKPQKINTLLGGPSQGVNNAADRAAHCCHCDGEVVEVSMRPRDRELLPPSASEHVSGAMARPRNYVRGGLLLASKIGLIVASAPDAEGEVCF